MAFKNVSDEERAVPAPLELNRMRSMHRLGISMTCFKVQNTDMHIIESSPSLCQSVTYSSTFFEMTTVTTTVSLFKPSPTTNPLTPAASNKIIQEPKEFIQFKEVCVRGCPDFNIKLRESRLTKQFLPSLFPGT